MAESEQAEPENLDGGRPSEPVREPTPPAEGMPAPVAASVPAVSPLRAALAARRQMSPWTLALDLGLIALIVIGVGFRFAWRDWNQGAALHPDEYGLTNTISQLRLPDTLGDYLNTRLSPLSPYQKYDIDGNPIQPSAEFPAPDNRMRWGQWPITLIRLAAEATDNTGYDELRLMGRSLSALADTLAVLVIILIGMRLYSLRVGLMAGALSALAVMQIQQSHFMTADNFGTLFTVLSMYAAVRIATDRPRARVTAAGLSLVQPERLPGGSFSVAGLRQHFRYSHTWLWYALFGVFFGMALASRVNLAPLAAEVVVAAVVAYAAQWQRQDRDRGALLTDAMLRLALAGVVAFLTFRVTQPMTFRAKTGDTTLLTLQPNQEWLDSMGVAQVESSGVGGGPPAEQWTDRTALVFPFVNMVVWGMGLPLGLTAWAGLLWATWLTFKSSDDESWKKHALPLTWAGGYFLFMGTRWVKSIRYFLPIYPFMALFAAWAVVALWKKGNEYYAGRLGEGSKGSKGTSELLESEAAVEPTGRPQTPLRRFRPFSPQFFRWASVIVGAVVLLGTLGWAWGYTSIYRNLNTRLAATRWLYEHVPAPFTLSVETADGPTTELIPIQDGLTISADQPYRAQFTAHYTSTLTAFTVAKAWSPFTPEADATLHIVLAADPNGSQVLAEGDLLIGGGSDGGATFSMPLGPAALTGNTTYYVLATVVSGGPVKLHNIAMTNENWDEPVPVRWDNYDPFGGLYRGVTMDMHWVDDGNKKQMILDDIAQSAYIVIPSQRRLWASTRIPATYPMTILYYRSLFDGSLGFDLVASFQAPLVIGPLQFSAEAGTFAFGRAPANPPPGPNFPLNDNLLAAEEAFSVYDHAPVWIFQKRPDFDLAKAQAILDQIDLSTVVNLGPVPATETPTALRLPSDLLAILRAGGTWSSMFDFNGLLNRYEFLGVFGWYLLMLVMGWLAMPLAFVTFSGLPDRGYALAKTLALLVVTWLVWMAGSFKVLPFTQGSVALGFLALAAISGFIYWRRRAEINAFVRANRRYIIAVEVVGLTLFAFDLFIRLGNPDLWHPSKGGEKPMVFSFFNAVLKSEFFPPYSPWLAGYMLNYYYYGFVIAAIPTKLLGIVPAFAYNLILPMLFSLVGGNAFGVAYNLVAASKEKGRAEPQGTDGQGTIELGTQGTRGTQGTQVETEVVLVPEVMAGGDPALMAVDDQWAATAAQLDPPIMLPPVPMPEPLPAPITPAPAPVLVVRRRSGPNPYVAGIAAALLVVVLGNLAQVYTFANGFRRAADHAALTNSAFGDNDFTATVNGFWRVVSGQSTLPVGSDSWYWDASRIVTSLLPEHEQEITEFPFFTFLYADLHAHMLDMPFTLLALAWAVSYLLAARVEAPKRRWLEWGAVWVIGGLALGLARATNTWDYPLFLALGALAVIAGEWARQPKLSRALLFSIAWRVALLLVLELIFYHPFDQYFAAAYSEVKRWEGHSIPIAAYLYIHGLFLFILTTFLLWETRRWLAETPATVLNTANEWLPIAALGALVLVGAVAAVWVVFERPMAVIALPLMAWAGLLLLRRGDAMSLSKRVVLFLLGTALAVTVFVEFFTLSTDRMNTIFKFYIQVWVLFSVAGGAALAWVWGSLPEWRPRWRTAWISLLMILGSAAALYTVTATAAKVRDRFPAYHVTELAEQGCAAIPGMVLPYDRGMPENEQPHSLYGLDYMTWSAYCDHDGFLPLTYDHDAIRWLQDNVIGSPVIVEAQSFDLYKMSSRYAWNTGLPDVVGWDYHTRQHNGAIPTEFITQRGVEVTNFYTTTNPDEALAFLNKYDARFVIVGPMEQAYYLASGGLDKFDVLVSRGALTIVYQNPGVIIYALAGTPLVSR